MSVLGYYRGIPAVKRWNAPLLPPDVRTRRKKAEGNMTTTNLGDTAQALVDDGKGILAADETVATVTKRLAALTIDSTPDSRRDYREMFLTTSGIADIHQRRHPSG